MSDYLLAVTADLEGMLSVGSSPRHSHHQNRLFVRSGDNQKLNGLYAGEGEWGVQMMCREHTTCGWHLAQTDWHRSLQGCQGRVCRYLKESEFAVVVSERMTWLEY